MTEEYLSGSSLMYAIGDAIKAGEGPEVFEIYQYNRWSSEPSWSDLILCDENNSPIRRKPRMRHLTDMHGQRWGWPEPMHHVSKGERYWSTFEKLRNRPSSIIWSDSGDDLMRLANGFCHRTIDAVEQHARALIAASGGNND